MICVYHVRIGPSWMDPIIQFLSKDVLPEDKSEVEKIRRKAPRFWLSEDQKLYKRFLCAPPFFDGSNYAFWKVRMRAFLCAIDELVWDSVENGMLNPR